jgi:hypothetical protein
MLVIWLPNIFCNHAASGYLIESECIFIRHSIAQSIRAERPKGQSSSPGEGKIFLLSKCSRLVLEPTQPPIQWAPGVLSLEAKWAGGETNHLPPTIVVVKKI